MKNKNTVLFFVLSMILLGAYYLLTSRLNPPVAAPQSVQTAAPTPGPAPAAQAAPTAVPTALASPTFTKAIGAYKLTWRTLDGALVQAIWAQDGTPFFNEEAKDKSDKIVSLPFLGLGGALGATFDGEPVVTAMSGGQAVTF